MDGAVGGGGGDGGEWRDKRCGGFEADGVAVVISDEIRTLLQYIYFPDGCHD